MGTVGAAGTPSPGVLGTEGAGRGEDEWESRLGGHGWRRSKATG